MPTVDAVDREDLSSMDLVALLAWLEEAYGDPVGTWRRETWSDIGPGPHFMLRGPGGDLVSHACIDWITVVVGERELAAGYLELVATRADSRGRGYGKLVVEAAQRAISERAEIGMLGTGEFAFYERLGWVRWTGPTSVVERDGSVTRTREEDGSIMALITPRTPAWVRTDLPIRRPRRDPEEAW